MERSEITLSTSGQADSIILDVYPEDGDALLRVMGTRPEFSLPYTSVSTQAAQEIVAALLKIPGVEAPVTDVRLLEEGTFVKLTLIEGRDTFHGRDWVKEEVVKTSYVDHDDQDIQVIRVCDTDDPGSRDYVKWADIASFEIVDEPELTPEPGSLEELASLPLGTKVVLEVNENNSHGAGIIIGTLIESVRPGCVRLGNQTGSKPGGSSSWRDNVPERNSYTSEHFVRYWPFVEGRS